MVKEFFSEFKDTTVVLDTATPIIYAGEFAEADEYFITLKNVDMQDSNDTAVSKAQYIIELKRDGVMPNRKEIKVKQSEVISICKLENIITF